LCTVSENVFSPRRCQVLIWDNVNSVCGVPRVDMCYSSALLSGEPWLSDTQRGGAGGGGRLLGGGERGGGEGEIR
jgi:hypothetical protein